MLKFKIESNNSLLEKKISGYSSHILKKTSFHQRLANFRICYYDSKIHILKNKEDFSHFIYLSEALELAQHSYFNKYKPILYLYFILFEKYHTETSKIHYF